MNLLVMSIIDFQPNEIISYDYIPMKESLIHT